MRDHEFPLAECSLVVDDERPSRNDYTLTDDRQRYTRTSVSKVPKKGQKES